MGPVKGTSGSFADSELCLVVAEAEAALVVTGGGGDGGGGEGETDDEGGELGHFDVGERGISVCCVWKDCGWV